MRSESEGGSQDNLSVPDPTDGEPKSTRTTIKLMQSAQAGGHRHYTAEVPSDVPRAQDDSLRLTPEARAALESAVRNFSRNLESRARYNTPDEVLQARDIKNAEGDLLASPVGTVIAQTVAWLRPAGFFCLGLTGPAMQAVLANQPVQPGQFVIGFIGGAVLGATWALDAQTVRIKRWWRARKETKALAQASSAPTSRQ